MTGDLDYKNLKYGNHNPNGGSGGGGPEGSEVVVVIWWDVINDPVVVNDVISNPW